MTHQILAGMSSTCLHCDGEAHPTHLIGERKFYCAAHCPNCQPAVPLPEREVGTLAGSRRGCLRARMRCGKREVGRE